MGMGDERLSPVQQMDAQSFILKKWISMEEIKEALNANSRRFK
jgi:hypothetical protein